MLMCCTEITSARLKGPKCLNNFVKWDGAQNHPILVLMPTAKFKWKCRGDLLTTFTLTEKINIDFLFKCSIFLCWGGRAAEDLVNFGAWEFQLLQFGNSAYHYFSECANVQRSTLWIDSSSLSADSVFGTWSVPGVNISLSRTMPFCA